MNETPVQDGDVIIRHDGALRRITLNRPQALNAITLDMAIAMTAALRSWAADPAVGAVLIDGAGERAFCAGGDIRALYDAAKSGSPLPEKFWAIEYKLNVMIARYPKPFIAIMDGLVMGGGVGVSVHGSHRVAGDLFQFAMPEVGIGFFPDVGATWFLPRMPGELGTYCGLTGERFGSADGCAAGVATHRIPSARFGALLDGLTGAVSVDALLAAFAEPAGEGPILAKRSVIDRLFVGDRVEDILAALDREAASGSADAEWAAKTAAAMRTKSPLSLKLALAQVRRGKAWDFETCMRAEFRIVSRVIRGSDFYEGVRAVIVDKDNKPRWQPARLAEVSDAEVERHFAALGAEELILL